MKKNIALFVTLLMTASINSFAQNYYMPGEDLEHEGTWLQWPHNNLYGPFYQGDVEDGWVTMTNALQSGEKVHIIAYDNAHQNHIINLLTNASVPLTNVDFQIFPTDDVWVRDNGPMYVYDQNDELVILDWGFNGWGNDTPFTLCDVIPQSISNATGISRVDLSAMVLEGGAIEHDGHGTMMATRSSITHPSRNPNLTELEIESYLSTYMGITNFIWLDGVYGQDITDHHIDGFVKFANENTIVTMDSTDLDYWLVSPSEMDLIYNAVNASGVPYTIVTVPLTQNDVTTTYGNNLGYKGSYCNYYIGNDVVLVPIYNDPNDAVALGIIQSLYPNRNVVGVNMQNLYEYGGMVHCVTQQQPKTLTVGIEEEQSFIHLEQNYPNPCSSKTTIAFQLASSEIVNIDVLDINGSLIYSSPKTALGAGNQEIIVNTQEFASGVYFYQLQINGVASTPKRMLVQH